MTNQDFQKHYSSYKLRIEKRLARLVRAKLPITVYDPMNYVLNAGGKRVRSLLTLLACEAVEGNASQALDAAVAIEVLHNFTLVHDDVMDNSSMRRGRPTVHTKWDTNIAILAGDEMIAYGYLSLSKTTSNRLREIMNVYNDAFIQVCEGQGFDKEFETRTDVTVEEYLVMIRKKTARVISAAVELGAIIGNGMPAQIRALKSFGENLGIAFQIQDDLLDIAGDEAEFGKPIGGDILEGKKTFLLLKALEKANVNDRSILNKVVHKNHITSTTVKHVLRIYRETGILDETRTEVAHYTRKANKALQTLTPNNATTMLGRLSERLVDRNS